MIRIKKQAIQRWKKGASGTKVEKRGWNEEEREEKRGWFGEKRWNLRIGGKTKRGWFGAIVCKWNLT